MKALNRQNLSIPTRPIKVLQFGEGNFLRGFVDWIVDVMNEKTNFNGDVHIIQPLPQGLGDMLNKQDGLYHVRMEGIQAGNTVQETRLITCVRGVTNPFEDYDGYLELGENPALEFIISNTTEAGIAFDEQDKSFDSLPNTFPGKLAALLYHRYTLFDGDPTKGLIIIPCELIDKNGAQLKNAILNYIALWDLPSDFKTWIQTHNTFCNTLVDRIVPGYPKDTIGEIQQEIGFEDKLVVMTEPFHLWVIEGPAQLGSLFPASEAELQVKFVPDQSPYRTRKVRILNGAHTAMVPVAYLKGIRTVRDAVEHEEMGEIIKKTIYKEIIPTLDLPQEELEKFANDVLDRFRNPFIHHELLAISLNSISKFKVRVLPSLLEYQNRFGTWPKHLIQAFAALILFYKGKVMDEPIPLNDDAPVIAFFEEIWRKGDLDHAVTATLEKTDFWNEDLSKRAGLKEAILNAIQKLDIESVKK